MATVHVALLRGINVARSKRVGMAELRELVEDLGHADVKTLLNSGNLVFTSKKGASSGIADQMEKAIATALGVTTRATVLTAQELDELIAANPLTDRADDPSRLLAAVLREPKDRSQVEPLMAKDWGNEALALGPRAAYLWCPDGVLGGKLFETVDRLLGDRVTSRNWSTLLKLQQLAREQR